MDRSSRTYCSPAKQASRKRHMDQDHAARPPQKRRFNEEKELSRKTSTRKVSFFSHIEIPTPPSWVLADIRRNGIVNNGSNAVDSRAPPANRAVQVPTLAAKSIQESTTLPHETYALTTITNKQATTNEARGPSIGSLHSQLNIDACQDNCRVLSFFGLFHDSGMVICTLHAARLKIIPLDSLAHHLDRHHRFSAHRQLDAPKRITNNSISRANVLRDFVAHVSACCGIPFTQSFGDLSSGLAVEVPIRAPPGISDATAAKSVTRGNEIKPRFKCPARQCDFWSSITLAKGSAASELIRHARHRCQYCGPVEIAATMADGADAPRPRYVQRMSLYRGNGQRPHPLYRFFTLPPDWEPPANGPDSDIPPPNPPNPTDTESISDTAPDPKPPSGKPALTAEKKDAPVWVQEAKWLALRRQLGRHKPGALQRLIELPSLLSTSIGEGPCQYIEKGLWALKAVAWDYLAEANTFIAAQALDVRHVLGKGLSRRFIVRSPASLYKPRSMLISIFGLLLRVLRAMQEKDTKGWGGFRLQCSADQLTATRSLYDLLIETKGSPDLVALQNAFHRVCVTLLQPESLPDDLIAYPTEQVLFIFSMAPGAGWISALNLHERCRALQLVFQLIFIQKARLSLDLQDVYHPWSAPENVAIPVESLPEDNESCISIEDNLFSDDADPFDPRKVNQTRDSLLAVIQQNIRYISARPSDLSLTPVSRLTVFATLVFKEARNEWSALDSVNNEGFEITVTPHDSRSLPANVNLFNWSYAAHQAIASFLHRLNMLLPPGCTPEDLDCRRLTDIYSPDALFKQRDNAVWLNPLRKDFRRQLTAHFGLASNGIINTDTIVKWFDHDQSVQAALAVVIGMCCGIIPPQHEYRILWDSTDKELRGVYLTPDKTVIVVNPSARPKDNGFGTGVYALPEIVANAVMYYFSMVRPTACDLLNLLGRDGDDSVYATEIWAHYRRQGRSSYHWSGPEISKPIQQHTLETLGVSWSPGDIRKTFKSMSLRYLPNHMTQATNSLVDLAAQHTSMTSFNHYGRVALFPPLPHFRHDQPIRSVILCRIWQGILGLRLQDSSWKALFHGVSLLPRYPWLGSELHHARAAIHAYKPQYNSIVVERMLRLQPFVYGPRMEPVSELNPWVDLGDEVLVRVMKSILDDPGLPPMSFAPAHSKMDVELVAYAICLIIRALNEWMHGTFADLSTLNVESRLHYHKIYLHYVEALRTFKSVHGDAWLGFSRII